MQDIPMLFGCIFIRPSGHSWTEKPMIDCLAYRVVDAGHIGMEK